MDTACSLKASAVADKDTHGVIQWGATVTIAHRLKLKPNSVLCLLYKQLARLTDRHMAHQNVLTNVCTVQRKKHFF